MGTGIVSVALELAGHHLLSKIFLVLTAFAWIAFVVLIGLGARRHRSVLGTETRTPAALTAVAATAVLGSRLDGAGLRVEAGALLIVGGGLWAALSLLLVRARELPSTGSSFMVTVAPESLGVLAAGIAVTAHSAWLTWPALVACAFGLASYPLVLVRFDLRQLSSGAGDQWVAGGALAISALATSEVGVAAKRVDALRGLVPALHTVSVVLWVLGVLWLVVLVASEAAWPRLGYDLRRWSTVFPVGMYCACSFAVGRSAGPSSLITFASIWVWVSVAVWAVVAGTTAGQAARHTR